MNVPVTPMLSRTFELRLGTSKPVNANVPSIRVDVTDVMVSVPLVSIRTPVSVHEEQIPPCTPIA
jgi:hypothetical protein